MDNSNIRHFQVDMIGTKKAEIPTEVMGHVMSIVLDPANHPIMFHCNHGKVCFANPTPNPRTYADPCLSTAPAV